MIKKQVPTVSAHIVSTILDVELILFQETGVLDACEILRETQNRLHCSNPDLKVAAARFNAWRSGDRVLDPTTSYQISSSNLAQIRMNQCWDRREKASQIIASSPLRVIDPDDLSDLGIINATAIDEVDKQKLRKAVVRVTADA